MSNFQIMIDFLLDASWYYGVVGVMFCLAPIVFIALHRITAGYGVMYNPKWGPTISNRLGWIIMEAPAFVTMLLLWVFSPRALQLAPAIMASLFLLHYFQRSFIFPLLIKGKGKMPWTIIFMGFTFNVVNAYMIGDWIFYLAPADMYPESWLSSPLFILGLVIFLLGMGINLHSDNVIRRLRKPGDRGHYIPRRGMYRYVTAANYFGELTEWTGYAILTWSLGGLAFVVWTFANLAPRARSLHKRYVSEFGDKYTCLNRRYLIPFIY